MKRGVCGSSFGGGRRLGMLVEEGVFGRVVRLYLW